MLSFCRISGLLLGSGGTLFNETIYITIDLGEDVRVVVGAYSG